VARRILFAYPFQRRTARLLRVVYYLLLVFAATGALTPLMLRSQGLKFGDVAPGAVFELVLYGSLALGIRAWAVSIESRTAKQRTSVQPFLPTGGLTAPQPGWYPDPSGVPGQRYWDGQRWTAVAPGSTQVHHEGRVRSGAADGSRTEHGDRTPP
jgi:hypothetical protein